MPAPGARVELSPEYNPPILKGLKVHPDNPFRFEFILDQGDSVSANSLKPEAAKLIKYFLASLTIPEKDLWVNLSPYEKDRIVPVSFGQTEMGRDLLAEDYMLKQITASLIYPEGETGRKFWKRVYQEAAEKFGTTDIPVNTFNKVWIVPEKAVVYENAKADTAYVVESKLKVMLDQDYLALQKHAAVRSDVASVGADIVREVVIPELTKEVNDGKNFSQLRQVYNSLILATWYKKKIKDSILAQVYSDKNKIKGLASSAQGDVEAIYQRYLEAFKKGAYNYIKEEMDPVTQQVIPRKYFSGGFNLDTDQILEESTDDAMIAKISKRVLTVFTVFFQGLANKTPNDPKNLSKILLTKLASFDPNLRESAAIYLGKSDPQGDLIKNTDLIGNFIDPTGIGEAQKEWEASKPGLSSFDPDHARRNARFASLFALRLMLSSKKNQTWKDQFYQQVADRLDQEAELWLKSNGLKSSALEITKGTQEENDFIGKYQLGHEAVEVPSGFSFLENLRLIFLDWKKQNKSGMEDWVYESALKIVPEDLVLGETKKIIFAGYPDRAMNVPGLDLDGTIRFSLLAADEPLIMDRDPHQGIQEMGYHERVLTPNEVRALVINEVKIKSILNKIRFLWGGRKFKALFDRVIGELENPLAQEQPFTIKEVSFLSPVSYFSKSETVYARYFLPKRSEGKKLPAVIICSFYEQDYYARLISTYLVSQGIAVLEMGLPLYGRRSFPGTEGMNSVKRYVKLDFDPEKFEEFIIQSITDTSAAVRWLAGQKEIDASRISLTGQSMTGAIAMSAYLIDPRVKNIFALVPIVNYAHLLWSKGKRYAPIRELLEQKGVTEQDFNTAMEGLNLDQLAASVPSKSRDNVYIGAVENDELTPWKDTQSLISSLDQTKNIFSIRYRIPVMSPHLFGSMIVGVTSGFFEKMRDAAIGNTASIDKINNEAETVNDVVQEFKQSAEFDESIDPRDMPMEVYVGIPKNILDKFIAAMDRSDDPLIENYNSEYYYNVLLLAIRELRKDVWIKWKEKAIGAGQDKVFSTPGPSPRDLNEEYAVRPQELNLPRKISIGEGYYLSPFLDKMIRGIWTLGFKYRRNDLTLPIGELYLGWDDHSFTWVPVKIHKIDDIYRRQGLGEKAYQRLKYILGVLRSSGITPDSTTPAAQRMWQRSEAKIEYIGNYDHPWLFESDTGHAFIIRSAKARENIKTDQAMAAGISRRSLLGAGIAAVVPQVLKAQSQRGAFVVNPATEEKEALDILAHSKLIETIPIRVGNKNIKVHIVESMQFDYTEPGFVKGDHLFVVLENMQKYITTVFERENDPKFLKLRETLGDVDTTTIVRLLFEGTLKHELIHLFTNPGITGGKTLEDYRIKQETAAYLGEMATAAYPKKVLNELIVAHRDMQDPVMRGTAEKILTNVLMRLGFIDVLAAKFPGSPQEARQAATEQLMSLRYSYPQVLAFLRALSNDEIQYQARQVYEGIYGPLPDLRQFQPFIDAVVKKYTTGDKAMGAFDIIKNVYFSQALDKFVPLDYSYGMARAYFEFMMKNSRMASKGTAGLMRMNNEDRVLTLFSNSKDNYEGDGGDHSVLMKRAVDNGYSKAVEWITTIFYWNEKGHLNYLLLIPPTTHHPRAQYSDKMLAFLGIKREMAPELAQGQQFHEEMHDELIHIARLIKEAALKKGLNPGLIKVTTLHEYINELSPNTNLQALSDLPTYQETQRRDEDRAMAAKGPGDNPQKTYSISKDGLMTGSIYDKNFIREERERAKKMPTIVFDLNGTVLGAGYLRPGIVAQLQKLKKMGYRLVLWTGANDGYVKEILAQFPVMRQLFDLFITIDNTFDPLTKGPNVRKDYLKEIASEFGEAMPQDHETDRPINLFGYKLLVDDRTYPGHTFRSYNIKNLGFRDELEPVSLLADRVDVMVKSPEIMVLNDDTWFYGDPDPAMVTANEILNAANRPFKNSDPREFDLYWPNREKPVQMVELIEDGIKEGLEEASKELNVSGEIMDPKDIIFEIGGSSAYLRDPQDHKIFRKGVKDFDVFIYVPESMRQYFVGSNFRDEREGYPILARAVARKLDFIAPHVRIVPMKVLTDTMPYFLTKPFHPDNYYFGDTKLIKDIEQRARTQKEDYWGQVLLEYASIFEDAFNKARSLPRIKVSKWLFHLAELRDDQQEMRKLFDLIKRQTLGDVLLTDEYIDKLINESRQKAEPGFKKQEIRIVVKRYLEAQEDQAMRGELADTGRIDLESGKFYAVAAQADGTLAQREISEKSWPKNATQINVGKSGILNFENNSVHPIEFLLDLCTALFVITPHHIYFAHSDFDDLELLEKAVQGIARGQKDTKILLLGGTNYQVYNSEKAQAMIWSIEDGRREILQTAQKNNLRPQFYWPESYAASIRVAFDPGTKTFYIDTRNDSVDRRLQELRQVKNTSIKEQADHAMTGELFEKLTDLMNIFFWAEIDDVDQRKIQVDAIRETILDDKDINGFLTLVIDILNNKDLSKEQKRQRLIEEFRIRPNKDSILEIDNFIDELVGESLNERGGINLQGIIPEAGDKKLSQVLTSLLDLIYVLYMKKLPPPASSLDGRDIYSNFLYQGIETEVVKVYSYLVKDFELPATPPEGTLLLMVDYIYHLVLSPGNSAYRNDLISHFKGTAFSREVNARAETIVEQIIPLIKKGDQKTGDSAQLAATQSTDWELPVWNKQNIAKVFEPEMTVHLPLQIELSNIKDGGPKVGLTIKYNAHFQVYHIEVFIEGKTTGDISIIREVTKGMSPIYQIIHFVPIGGFDSDSHSQEINKKWTGQGIASTILNWIAWTAQSNGAAMSNSNTKTISLIRLYRQFFADDVKQSNSDDKWGNWKTISDEDVLYNGKNTAVRGKPRPAEIPVIGLIKDNAMSSNTGGIDLTSDKALQVKNDGQNGINFKIDTLMLEELRNTTGFVPVIIDVQPLTDLRQFLTK